MTNRAGAGVFAAVVILGLVAAWTAETHGTSRAYTVASDVLPDLRDWQVPSANATPITFASEPEGWAVATEHPIATEAAAEILAQGGNAVDATIAASFAVAVAAPYGSGIGGGGAMVIARPDGDVLALDYLAASGTRRGIDPTAVPGFVPGLFAAHDRYGSLPWSSLLEPAIGFAKRGVPASRGLITRIAASTALSSDDMLRDGDLRAGDTLHQPDLADSFARIAADPRAATHGELAKAIAGSADGVALTDLASYEPRWSKAFSVSTDHGELHTTGAPTGGPVLAASLMALSASGPMLSDEVAEARSIAMFSRRWASIDAVRAELLGDPAHVDVDVDRVLEAAEREEELRSDEDVELGKSDTTHIAVIDRDGLLVSTTNTLSEFFGSGRRVSGFYLNNALDNFGGTRSVANRWQPDKRPRTFIAPSVLTRPDGQRVGVGSAGGRRIPTALAQVIVTAGHGAPSDWQRAVAAPRLHVDAGVVVAEDTVQLPRRALRAWGLDSGTIDRPYFFGGVQIAGVASNGAVFAAADPRREGSASARGRTPASFTAGPFLRGSRVDEGQAADQGAAEMPQDPPRTVSGGSS